MTSFTLPPGLAALADDPHWVNWNLEPRPGDPKPTKVPYTPSLRGKTEKAKAGDPTTWGDFATASAAAAAGRFTGIGYEFHAGAGKLLFDLDHVIDPETRKVEPRARAIVALADSYAEVSPSGTGIRIVAKGELPRPEIPEDRQGKKKGGCELYGGLHFGTLTFRTLPGYGTLRHIEPERMRMLFALMWPEDVTTQTKDVLRPVAPLAPVTLDDAALLDQAFAAKNGADFQARHGGRYLLEDKSADDFAYAMGLAFWTQNDAPRMRRIAQASGRARDKWFTRRGVGDLLDYTIAKACAEQHEIYDPQRLGGSRVVFPSTPGEGIDQAAIDTAVAERDAVIARLEAEREQLTERVAHCRDEHKRKDATIEQQATRIDALEAVIKHPDQAASVGGLDLIEAADSAYARPQPTLLTQDDKDYARVPFAQAANRRSAKTLARGFQSLRAAGKLDAFTRTERIETPEFKGEVEIAYIHIPPALRGQGGKAVLGILPPCDGPKKHGGRRTIDVPPEVAAQPNPVKRERELVTRWYDALSNEKLVTERPVPLATDYWTAAGEQRTREEIDTLRTRAGYQPAPTPAYRPTVQAPLRLVPRQDADMRGPRHLADIENVNSSRHLAEASLPPPLALVADIPGQCLDSACLREATIGGYCQHHYPEYSQRYATGCALAGAD